MSSINKENDEQVNNKESNNDDLTKKASQVFLALVLVFGFMASLFWAIHSQQQHLVKRLDDSETKKIQVVAKELGVKEKDVVLETGDSELVYTATTPKGVYKLKIIHEEEPVIKNMSEVKLYLKDEKNE
ncbi:hypothetical protein [Bacillus sp. NPDC094106]|uniref:hypothetical protein n=1 Tax=Bacillus sp. NPDC094106 TaxID=3363949 RepID=UPI00380B4F33